MPARTLRIAAGRALVACTLAAGAAAPAPGQPEQSRSIDIDGQPVQYLLRLHPGTTHHLDPAAELAPTSALATAQLLHRHLVAGQIDAAAALSNAPRRRQEVLRAYLEAVGEDEFKRVYARYFGPENRLVAEIAIERHRLLIWELREAATLVGQFFVETDGKVLMDDLPSETRTRLRKVLDAYRSGKAAN